MRLGSMVAGAAATAVVLGMAGFVTDGGSSSIEAGMTRGASADDMVNPVADASAPAKTGTLHSLKPQHDRIEAFGRTVAEIIGMEVEGLTGEHIGDVIDVFADASGDIKALAVQFGGFLGIGAKTVMLPATALQVDTDHFITAMSLAEVKVLSKHRR